MVPGTVGTGPDLEATLPLGIRPPQPSYDPQGHAERPRANARVQDEGMEHSGSLPSAVVTQDQGAGVRNGAHYVEESMDITVDVTD